MINGRGNMQPQPLVDRNRYRGLQSLIGGVNQGIFHFQYMYAWVYVFGNWFQVAIVAVGPPAYVRNTATSELL